MPVGYLRSLTAHTRTRSADLHLAHYLTLVAGAVNAGGFLAIGQYTSHMSGIVSGMADDVVLGQFRLAAVGLSAVCSFSAGAATSAWLINWGRRHGRRSLFAMPLALESGLLVLFAFAGQFLDVRTSPVLPVAAAMLCFLMGLQNAMITKLSRAEIRTTHVTGLITDIGIELGKLIYWNRQPRYDANGIVQADLPKLRLLSRLVACFFVGGVIGGLAFSTFGFVAALPIAAVLFALAVIPLYDDWVMPQAMRS